MTAKTQRQDSFYEVCVDCRLGCCQGVRPPITKERQGIIEAFLKSQNVPIDGLFVRTGYTFPKEDDEGYCRFFDRTAKKCLVHPVKPETCVAGPVTFDIKLQNGTIEWHVKTDKVCLLAAKIYENGEVWKKHLASAKKEILRLVGEIDAESLRTILKIQEPDTFKIGEDNLEEKVLKKLS